MVLTYDAYNETLESEKGKDDKLTLMEKQLNLMQNQFQMLISTLGNTNKNETERNSIAKNLYESGLIKEGTLEQQQQQQDDDSNKEIEK
jgi:hypothetical protein